MSRAIHIRGHWYDAKGIVRTYRSRRALPPLELWHTNGAWISMRDFLPFDLIDRARAFQLSGYRRRGNDNFSDQHVVDVLAKHDPEQLHRLARKNRR